MERLGKIDLSKLALPSRDAETTSLVSRPSLPDATGLALSRLMGQAMARYPNQELSELTQEMYLTEWEEMTARYGLPMFRDALSKAIRSGSFFPAPEVMRETCIAARHAEIEAEETQRLLAEREAYLKDVREHPENYVSMEKVWKEVEERMKTQ